MRPLKDLRSLLGAQLVLLVMIHAAQGDVLEPPDEAALTRIGVIATGLHHRDGQVLVALFATAEGFPSHVEYAVQSGVAVVENDSAKFWFEPLPRGTYAISVLHDENGDGHMKTGFFGQPKEGWGVSHDATGHFGPPSFEDASFDAKEDSVCITLKLRY